MRLNWLHLLGLILVFGLLTEGMKHISRGNFVTNQADQILNSSPVSLDDFGRRAELAHQNIRSFGAPGSPSIGETGRRFFKQVGRLFTKSSIDHEQLHGSQSAVPSDDKSSALLGTQNDLAQSDGAKDELSPGGNALPSPDLKNVEEATAKENGDEPLEYDEFGNVVVKEKSADEESDEETEEREGDSDLDKEAKAEKRALRQKQKKLAAEQKELAEAKAKEEAKLKKIKVVEKADSDAGPSQAYEGTVLGATPPPPVANQAARDPQKSSYDEWARKLLSRPDFKLTSLLIEYYQTDRISDQTFFRLVRDMIGDSRPQMRSLGVMAAGKTPSPQSFVILAQVQKEEPFGSDLRKKAETHLDTYVSITYLPVLEAIFSQSQGESVFALILATEKLDQAATLFLDDGKQAANEPPRASRVRSLATTRTFERFLGLLERVVKGNTDTSAVAVAQQTLTRLRELLGKTEEPVAT